MPLTDEQKAENRFQRMLQKSKEYSVSRYITKGGVARIFQEMIRAEAGANVGEVLFVRDGECHSAMSRLGECHCVTCGRVYPWRGTNKLDSGHFLSGRTASITFEETGVNPQCTRCNTDGKDDTAYELYMRERYGQDEIDRLWLLRNRPAERPYQEQWREHYVRKKIEYMDRTKVAIKAMGSDYF